MKDSPSASAVYGGTEAVCLETENQRWALTAEGEKTYRSLRPKWEAAQAALESQLGRAEAVALKKAAFLAANKLGSR